MATSFQDFRSSLQNSPNAISPLDVRGEILRLPPFRQCRPIRALRALQKLVGAFVPVGAAALVLSQSSHLSAQSLPSGLVAAYSFNEGSGSKVTDLSGNNITGTVFGATWTTAGKYGNALSFNGSNSYVDLGNPAVLNLTSSMTVSAWINSTGNPPDDGQIISKSDNYSGWQLKTSQDMGSRTFGTAVTNTSGSRVQQYSSTTPALNTWYFVAGVYDASARTMKVYVNGVLANGTLRGTVPSSQLSSTFNANIGRRSGGFYFKGIIDEVRVYNRALSQAEIQSDMNTPLASGSVSDTQPPTAPGNLTAVTASASQINLRWPASTDNIGVTGYLIERCPGNGCTNFTQVAAPSGTGTGFQDAGLASGAAYTYRVRAKDGANNLSSYSGVASATTAASSDTQPPTAPSGLAAAAASASQINLTWTGSTDNVGVANYQVERCSGAGCSNFASRGATTGTAYNDTGLAANTGYSYRVRAADAAGNLSSYSNIATATTMQSPDTQAPSAPGTVTATVVSGSQVNLSWGAATDNVGVTGYRVERCQGVGCGGFAQIATPAGTAYTDSGLASNTSYSYRVRATDAAGNLSTYSNIASGTTTQPSANPHYVTDATGKAVLLTGSHTWNTFQDTDQSTTPAPFDFNAYVNFLKAHGHNATILWKKDLPTYCNWGAGGTWHMSPFPWPRTGGASGTQMASDGLRAFDLSQFNQAYFDRLRARALQLQQNGIYAIVQLFDGLGLLSNRCSTDGYPFSAGNNVNGISDGGGANSMTMSAPNAITNIQDAYVQKVIDTVNDLTNVLWEVSEEAPSNSIWWQGHMISLVHTYEAGKPLKHPVGFPWLTSGSDSTLYNSNADWVAPVARISPTSSCGSGTPACKVNINDSDHSYYGMWNDSAQVNRNYIWENFANGSQVIFMDPYEIYWSTGGRNLCANPVNGVCSGVDPRWNNFRDNMGYTLTYANKMDLAKMTPQGGLSSTGYVLADAVAVGAEYLVYAPSGGSFTVNLSATTRTLNVEWFNPATGATISGGVTTGGSSSKSFTPPFSGDAVLYLVDSAGHA